MCVCVEEREGERGTTLEAKEYLCVCVSYWSGQSLWNEFGGGGAIGCWEGLRLKGFSSIDVDVASASNISRPDVCVCVCEEGGAEGSGRCCESLARTISLSLFQRSQIFLFPSLLLSQSDTHTHTPPSPQDGKNRFTIRSYQERNLSWFWFGNHPTECFLKVTALQLNLLTTEMICLNCSSEQQ